MPTKRAKKHQSSKDSASVFDYIGMLKHERRILLLKALFEEKKPIAFMDLLRKCKIPRDASPDASYHLAELKDKGIVVQQDTKYFLSSFGEDLLEKFFELEDVFSNYTAGILVRTSRYSMEQFSEEKIAAALMREARMPSDKAAEIARETRIRLQRAKVQYLTTPLIREYINAILVEKHMEDYRHKLTRLGVPGQDIEDALRSGGVLSLPQLLASVSRETLEQFVLLRILPKELADATLQRLIAVSRLGLFPFLPEENAISWAECGGEDPTSVEDLLLSFLRVITSQLHRFGKLLTISGVPFPSHIQKINIKKIEGPASAIEHLLRLEDKRVRVIFEMETLPEAIHAPDLINTLGKNIEFFSHQERFPQINLPLSSQPSFLSPLEEVVPCFESFYCNLPLLLKAGKHEAILLSEIDRVAEIIAGILSIKEESMLAHGYPLSNSGPRLVRIRPIGLPEIVKFLRGFEIDQTEDSQGYSRKLLQELQARVSKRLGGQFQVQLGQSWSSPHLLPFTEAAVNEVNELKGIMYHNGGMAICSPGFTRLTGKWSGSKCMELASCVLDRIPGEFYLNLEIDGVGRDTKPESPFRFELSEGQSFILIHENQLKIGSLDIYGGNFF